MLLRKGLLIWALGCAIGAMSGALPSRAGDEAVESVPETAKTCITDKRAGIFDYGTRYTFEMDLENSCARKISCTVDVYVSSAKGPVSGHGVLVLEPRGQTPTLKTYTMKVKSNVGMSQAQRECKFV